MKVIAEFIDNRNGKRYFPGEGWKIDPALGPDQIKRLTQAGCLADGKDEKPADVEPEKKGDELRDTKGDDEKKLERLTKADLLDLAKAHNVADVTDDNNKAEIVAKLLAANVKAPEK